MGHAITLLLRMFLSCFLAGSLITLPHGRIGAFAYDGMERPQLKDQIRQQILDMAKINEQTKEQLDNLAATVQDLERDLQESNSKERRLDDYSVAQPLDTMWLLLCGALVMFMQCGFAMLEAGCCRMKNVQHILLKNFTDVCVGTLGWFIFGYTFAYRGEYDEDGSLKNGGFIGYEAFAGVGFYETGNNGIKTINTPTLKGDYTMYIHWFFQWAFCTAAATIVSGGVAERVNFKGYVIYSFFMSTFIYPVLVAWTWGYGWIAGEVNDVGYIDFAGSGIVHMAGGVGALMGALLAGSRKDRWLHPEDFCLHSLPLVVLGTFILWFGWYGFNCGSTLSMKTDSDAAKAALVAMNTTTSAAAGGITALFVQFLVTQKYDLGGLCNGILAGLVSITAPCSNVDIGTAIVIGMLGGYICVMTSLMLKRLHVDDPLDAFPVHGACGAWGVLAAALFDWGEGFKYANGWSGFTCAKGEDGCDEHGWSKTFAANMVEILMVIVWVGGLSGILFSILKLLGLLTLGDEEQDVGADVAEHTPTTAYVIRTPSNGSNASNKKVETTEELVAGSVPRLI